MRTLAITIFAVTAALAATAGPAAAAQLFVYPEARCEYPTIQAAVNAAQPGDTIRLRDGIYNENVTVPAGRDGLTFRGAQAGVAGDGTDDRGPESVLVDMGGTALRVLSSGVKVDGVTIAGGNVGVSSGAETSGLQVVNSRFNYLGTAIIAQSNGDAVTTISHNRFGDANAAPGVGVEDAILTGSSHARLLIAHNRIIGGDFPSAQFGAQATDLEVLPNRAEDPRRFAVVARVDDLLVEDNVVDGAGLTAISGVHGAQIRHNVFHGRGRGPSAAGIIVDGAVGSNQRATIEGNDFAGDPDFTAIVAPHDPR